MAQLFRATIGQTAGSGSVWKRGRSLLRQQGALAALIILVLFATFRYQDFFTPYNIYTFLSYNTMFGLIGLGMTFVIMTGGIDLSVGSVVALASVVAARISPLGLFPSIIAVVLLGALIGLFNGVVIAHLRIPPFIATLAMLLAARGLALLIAKEAAISADSHSDFTTIYTDNWLGIPVPIYILVAAYIIGSLVLNYTRFGRHVLAIGGNEEATRLMGLPVERITIMVYVISGALAGLTGLLLAAQTFTGNPNEGVGWELSAIASVVVGGTLLTGGMGTVGGTLVGVLLLGLIFNVLNFENGYGFISLSSYWETVIRGAFLFIVVILQSRLTRKNSALLEEQHTNESVPQSSGT